MHNLIRRHCFDTMSHFKSNFIDKIARTLTRQNGLAEARERDHKLYFRSCYVTVRQVLQLLFPVTKSSYI